MGKTPLDLDSILDDLDKDKDFLLELAGDLIERAKDQIKIMRKGVENKSYDEVRRTAHAIKGGALNLTAYGIAEIGLKIEKAGRAGDLSHGHQLIDQLEMEVQNLEKYIKNL